MTSREASAGPHSTDMNAFPSQQFDQADAGDAVSVLSSRMTDIASEDGREQIADSTIRSSAQEYGPRRGSAQPGDGGSRPNTAVTGISSQRGQWSQAPPSRRGYAPPHSQRGSISGSTIGGRPLSSSNRTHVPSLQSHAFFRPMSSQRLQQQRRGSRPSVMGQLGSSEDGPAEGGDITARHYSLTSNQTAKQGQSTHDHGESLRPLSRGTEMTDHETAERVTANTSPTNEHNAPGSLSESVRPLQRNGTNTKGLSLNIDKSYKNGENLSTPRSFRSNFLLPSRGDTTPNSPGRSTQGREKLSSIASSPGLTPTDAPKTFPKPKLGTNYEYFTGNTAFFWGGRLQNTRDKPISIATGFAVLLPGVLFLIFSASWLWHNISPAIPIVFAYGFYLCMSSFIHASLSDPGILPRNLHPMPPPDENEDPLALAPPTNDWTLIKSATSNAAAMEVPTKYCKTCNIWRPPRGHHCRVCDNCIETQDHHCVWINNCVGRRNYRYFFVFLTTSTFLGLFILGASLAQIIVYMNQHHISFAQSISHFRVPFAMVIYSALAVPYPAALMGYHLFLMARGDTTREYLNSHKFLKKDRHRPFTQGNFFKNWLVVLARPRPPTYLNFKRKYEDGDQRFGERKGRRTAPVKEEFQGQGVDAGMEMGRVAERGFQGPNALRVEGKN